MVANRINTTLAPTITQATLGNAIKTAMTNSGFGEPHDDYTSTNRVLVYERVVDASKTYGKDYMIVSVTPGLVINSWRAVGWNTSTKSSLNPGTVTSFSALSSSTSISFAAFDGGDEYRIVHLVQGSTVIPIGEIIPAVRPTWWDLNSYPFGFSPVTSGYSTWRSCALNPYGNDTYILQTGLASMANANPVSGRRDIQSGLLLYSNSNAGIAAKTSDEIAIVSGNGLTRYDVLQPQGTNQQYTVLVAIAGGFALRTA